MLKPQSRLLRGVYGTLLGALLCLVSAATFAVDCVEKSTGSANPPAIPVDALAIPSNVPSDTKVWESNEIHVTAYCDNVTQAGADPIYFYFNPKKQFLGQGIKLGVSYRGTDLEGGDRLITDAKPIRKGESVTFDVSFRLYIKTSGTPPSSGHYEGNDQFTVFQLDGELGLNYSPGARNLKYTLSNLRSIRFLACGADLKVNPENQEVDFGTLQQGDLLKGRKYLKPFSITATKQGCSDMFSLKAEFSTSSPLINNTHIDLQNGTQLRILDENQNEIVYNRYDPFASLDNVTQVTKPFNAEVSARSGQSIKLGNFSATTVIKITYY